MTRLLPFYAAVLAFSIVPFVWFAAVPTYVGYLVTAALLGALALEAWKRASRRET